MRRKYKIGIWSGVIGVLVTLGLALFVRGIQSHAVLEKIVVDENETSMDVNGILKSYIGIPLQDVLLLDVEDTLRIQGGVASVVVRKQYPNMLRVKLFRRRFVGIVMFEGQPLWVDQFGKVAEKPHGADLLPVLDGTRFSKDKTITLNKAEVASLELCNAISKSDVAKMVLTKVVFGEKMYATVLGSHARFFFGGKSVSYEKQIEHFVVFWKRAIVKNGLKNLVYADFRFKGKIYAKFEVYD